MLISRTLKMDEKVDTVVTLARLYCMHMTKNMDKSHDAAHHKKVADWVALISAEEEVEGDELVFRLVCAWLHDIADHKYDKDGTIFNRVWQFACALLGPAKGNLAAALIKRISWSAEVRDGTGDWPLVLGTKGTKARNAVSDADKLEALGKTGFMRCVEYTKTKWDGEGAPPHEWVKAKVIEHCNEKLYALPKFLHSDLAKKAAVGLLQELKDCVDAM